MNIFSKVNYHASKQDVQRSAEHLILANGQTTTLEVKLHLRRQGYLAYQSDVSYWMAQLAEELHWNFSCNGRHRTYQFPVYEEWYEELLVYHLN